MTITNGYCTLVELQQHLGRDTAEGQDSGSGDINADFLESCITRASRIVDIQLGIQTHLNQHTITAEYLDCYGISDSGLWFTSDMVTIRSGVPIISVTTLSEDGTALVENTDFYLYKNKIEASGAFSTGRKAYRITASIGYSAIPDEIKAATIQIASALSGLAITAYTDDNGDTTTVIQKNIPKWVYETLDLFRGITM